MPAACSEEAACISCAARASTLRSLALFFQGEDGIRHLTVTGVQTCALPILRESVAFFDDLHQRVDIGLRHQGYLFVARSQDGARAQEALVAEQRGWGLDDVELLDGQIGRASCRERCRSRWSPYH